MADVSAQTWKVTFDSTMTADQKAAAIQKLKDDGAKWYNANCGANAKDMDDESELGAKLRRKGRWAKLARRMKKKDQDQDVQELLDDEQELTTVIIRRRTTPTRRIIYVRHDEDDSVELASW